jgi:dCTP deaminase
MILTDKKILQEMKKGTIVINPFDKKFLGSNSYDVHLGKWLGLYKDDLLDCRQHNRDTPSRAVS